MFSPANPNFSRRLAGALLTSVAVVGIAAAPQAASAKGHHKHHTPKAKRAQAPTRACYAGELEEVGHGKAMRLFVCTQAGSWTEAVFALPSDGKQTTTVNAGRVS
jgi:uncharacterized low-complexity protein